MNIIGCLDRPTTGRIMLDGENISTLSDNELAEIRGRKVGFIFQKFNLIPTMNALKNVDLPMIFLGAKRGDRDRRGSELLEKVGLTNWATHKPSELSGGQQQRVAIARALCNNPSIIFADEPTGNLDTKTGEQIMELLVALNKEGKTILLVTHAIALKRFANRVVNMLDGEVTVPPTTLTVELLFGFSSCLPPNFSAMNSTLLNTIFLSTKKLQSQLKYLQRQFWNQFLLWFSLFPANVPLRL